MERKNRNRYIAQVRSLLGKGEAVVLTGHRRAGKSCILELLSADLSAQGNVIYIDMEDPANADLVSFRELSEKIKTSVVEGHRNYVLIDEVQEVAEFLNLSVTSVYTARSRCVATLREIIDNLEEK